MAEGSQKTADDDLFNDVLDKYISTGKGESKISKDDMLDACNEIYEKNKEVDSETAIMKVKEKFDKLWKEHDVTN